jgi:hypothetical protein
LRTKYLRTLANHRNTLCSETTILHLRSLSNISPYLSFLEYLEFHAYLEFHELPHLRAPVLRTIHIYWEGLGTEDTRENVRRHLVRIERPLVAEGLLPTGKYSFLSRHTQPYI